MRSVRWVRWISLCTTALSLGLRQIGRRSVTEYPMCREGGFNGASNGIPASMSGLSIQPSEISTKSNRVMCYLLSDIHAESTRNREWVKTHLAPSSDRGDDAFSVLIVPGDVGTKTETLVNFFTTAAAAFDCVCYLPGNHELWTQQGDNHSIQALRRVLDVATGCGAYIGPVTILYHSQESQPLTLMPLYSWYHSCWDREPELQDPLFWTVEKALPFRAKWADNRRCSWPVDIPAGSASLAKAFAALNEHGVRDLESKVGSPQHGAVISFSHFLPRPELCIEKRFLLEPLLTKVIGSDFLEAQIRRISPRLHLFGHTHLPIDLTLDGIRYIQWPLGSARESGKQCAAVVKNGPLLVYDTAYGGTPPHLASTQTAWSIYYRDEQRRPDAVFPLAPWLQSRLNTLAALLPPHSSNSGDP